MLNRVIVLPATVLLALAACGNDGNGNEDTLFRTLSSVLILAFVVWLLVRAARKRS